MGVLEFGFGQTFISWVRLLYTSPQARVYTNNHYSSYFSLSRGTCQGCQLSPLLFALVIEQLAIKLRTSVCLQGIERDGVKLDKVILPFLWAGKVARVKRSALQEVRWEGGLGLPVKNGAPRTHTLQAFKGLKSRGT